MGSEMCIRDSEKINKLDENTLILLGEEGDEYEWTRVEGSSDS